ncbi:MAG: GGDEF domain-containing protein [Pseudomonadota bacterium]
MAWLLDGTTQLSMTGVGHLIMAFGLVLVRRSETDRPAIRMWALSQIVLGVAMLLIMIRKPDSAPFLFVAPNVGIALGQGLMAVAICRYFQRPIQLLLAFTVIVAVWQLFIRFLGLPEAWRLFAVIGATLIQQLVILILFIKQRHRPSRLLGFLILGNSAVVLAYVARLVEITNAGPDYDFFHAGPGQAIGLMGAFANALINGFGFALLLKERADSELVRLASLDSLTEVLNRRSFLGLSNQLIAAAARARQPISLLICDIDHFKQINDRFGHHAGDEVIKALVRVTRQVMRSSDSLGRWGGEEFVILLPDTALSGAMQMAERLNREFAGCEIRYDGQVLQATVSIGAAECRSGETLQLLLDRADAALYRAKANGRNRVEAEAAVPVNVEAIA